MDNQETLPTHLKHDLISATKRLADAVEFDVNGSHGLGGNGGLTSDEALKAAANAKMVLSEIEAGQ